MATLLIGYDVERIEGKAPEKRSVGRLISVLRAFYRKMNNIESRAKLCNVSDLMGLRKKIICHNYDLRSPQKQV